MNTSQDKCILRAQRQHIECQVRAHKGHEILFGKSVNLSATGILVALNIPLRKGDILYLDMTSDSYSYRRVAYGMVVRTEVRKSQFLYGLNFVSPPPEDHCLTTDIPFYFPVSDGLDVAA